MPQPDQSPLDPSLHPTDTFMRRNLQLRPHPPRLQHSPSLPNLWLPPHFGPIPPRLLNMSRDNLHEPATPPALVTSFTLPEVPPAALSTADLPPVASSDLLPAKTFQFVDRERSGTLLTPPLTPSSSIRTTASVDTNATSNHSVDFVGEKTSDHIFVDIDDRDSTSRFLMVQNVSPQASSHQLENLFLHALRNVESDKPSSSHIKCISKKHQDQGIVLLLFYDLRVGSQAKDLFSRKGVFPLDFLAEGADALTCGFLTLEEILKLTGHSPHLEAMDGALLLRVDTKSASNGPNSGQTEKTSVANSVDPNVCRMALLKRFLTSFGALRLFAPAHETSSVDKAGSGIFLIIEYFDVRDAKFAVQMLDGKDFYDAVLHVAKQAPSVPQEAFDVPADTPCGIPFPSAEPSHRHTQSNVHESGRISSTRERLLCRAGLGRIRPRSVSVDHTESPTSHDSPVTSSSASPLNGFAYTYSTSASIPQHYAQPVQQTHDLYPHQNSAPMYPPSGRTPRLRVDASYETQYPHIVSPNAPLPERPSQLWVVGQESIYNSPEFNANYSFPPRDGVASRCVQTPVISPNSLPFCPMPPHGTSYLVQYPHGGILSQGDIVQSPVDGTLHAVVNANSPTESPLLVPLIATSHGFVAPNGGGLWLGSPHPTRPVVATNQGTSAPQLPRDTSSSRSDSRAIPETHIHASTVRDVSVSPDGTPSQTPPTLKPCTKNNALDILAIEAGLDTRTTVMIRNIPNKMSDKDLITYIASVCPRSIDFLYLRMDFKNGCNVGYAFVNFITVEDLVAFAKAKLGKKWNMFASEKVLEMSYADYQGKEAQVEKFKNSSIMDEKEEWRPKIFRSEPGPEQGLPEPFPAPTHLRRKQLSSHNRVGLFPRNPKPT